ncbi:MAG: hypothetical protein ABW138_04190, partial [Candidatus Thiodiazotropha sp. 4PDIVS1]
SKARERRTGRPIQVSATTLLRLVGRPEGRPAHQSMLRCTPWKGLAIPCGVRLALTDERGSDRYLIYRMAH